MRARSLAAAFALVCLVGLPGLRSQTLVSGPPSRIVLHRGLPAVDGGLRSFSAPSQLPGADQGATPYVPGRVIVKFRQSAGGLSRASVARALGGAVYERLPHANFDLIDLPPDDDAEEAARRLSARSDVEYAQASYRMQLHFVPNDPLYRSQWNFQAIDMERAWDINRDGASAVVVAVIDSGVAFEDIVVRYDTRPIPVLLPGGVTRVEHGTIDVPYAAAPDLVRGDRIVAPFDFVWNDRHPLDTLGHGTHVAGTIGQLTDNGMGGAGMAYNVRLMPLKVAGSYWDSFFGAPSPFFTDDQVARAIRYAADNGAKVINMSFGRNGPAAPVVEDAVRHAVSRGAFCVVSAGNGALQGNSLERFAEIASRVDGAVSVGAVGPDLTRAWYSSSGPWVELTAPGGEMWQRGPSGGILQQTLDTALFADPLARPRFDVVVYAYYQGTSMAAPHVTGFAALLIQQGITNPAAIEAAMKRFATDRGPAGRDDEYGVGTINPPATLRGLGLAR